MTPSYVVPRTGADLLAILDRARQALPPAVPERHGMQRATEVFGRPEPVPSYRIKDWFEDMGLPGWGEPEHVARLGGTTWCDSFTKPRGTFASGPPGMLPMNLAAALLELERLGLPTGAMWAVAVLRPSLARRKRLTAEELRVWWAPREHVRKGALELTASAPEGWPTTKMEVWAPLAKLTARPPAAGLVTLVAERLRPARAGVAPV